MGFPFERFIAARYLKSKRREVFVSIIAVISIVGVALSVVVLNMVLSIMTGFEGELRRKLVGANAHIIVRQSGQALEQAEEVVARVQRIPGVKAAFPYTSNQVMLSSKSGTRGLIVRGVANDRAAKEKLEAYFSDETNVDRLFETKALPIVRPDGTEDTIEFPSLLVGRELARRINLSFRNPVTLFSPELRAGPAGLVPRQRRFALAGTYRTGLVEYESGVAYMSLENAQAFFSMGSAVTGVEIELENLLDVKRVGAEINEALSGLNGFFFVTDWMEQNQPLWEALKLEKQVYFIVLLLLILLASFSIVSTLVMVVMEKSRDIAVLKSLGASNNSVMKIFLLQGALIGLSGTIIGTVLGYLGCVALREYGFPIDVQVFSLDTVPVYIVPENFLTVAVAAFLITSLAGIYPARRAAKIDPAVAFRFD